jgi:arylsulfatase A-like enzyme
VLLVIADDQRFDKITPQYMPNVSAWSQASGSMAFTNSFIPNPLCCPSRTTILTGRYSHSTGVWTNEDGPYGGFSAFNDAHTLATDFQDQGYRTAMIGKYLNGYNPGQTTYVPPGWSKWFATRTGAYYDYQVQTKTGTLSYGSTNNDYSTKVLKTEATNWITSGGTKPFFAYVSFSAPHGPAIPQSLDIGRFAGQTDYTFGPGTSMLESAFGVDRAFGQILAVLPTNTIVVYMSDNGFMWGENHPGHGTLDGKLWPYNTSIRVPIIIGGVGNAVTPLHASIGDVVSNVDLRTSLLHAAGLAPESPQAGVNWFDSGYVPRSALLLEHYDPNGTVTYCGARSAHEMWVRFQNNDGSHTTESYSYTGQGSPADEQTQSTTDPSLAALAQSDCGVPGYSWP